MPGVPQRKPSYGELLNKLRPQSTIICPLGTKDIPTWEETRTKNDGPVKVTTLPDPLKCSKCDYIAVSRPDLNEHWLLDH